MTMIALLLAGLAMLLAGARWFVNGVSTIAASLGVPPLVIGLTVVAFGTSTPELVINGLSASRGSTALAFGNIVGSCIVNIGFVLAVTAILQPLRVDASMITREIPMLIVAVSAVLILANDRLLDLADVNRWTRTDGVILLLFFAIFLYYSTRQALAARNTDQFIAEVESSARPAGNIKKDILLAAVGLILMSVGADFTVDNAVLLARDLGISEAVIGLTVISIGTTLPELATCVLAARRGDPDIVLGNIVGSNIFNLLCIGGIVAAIAPIEIPEGGSLDLAVMALLTAVLLPIAIRSGRLVTRGEGVFLLTIFVAYLSWRVVGALQPNH